MSEGTKQKLWENKITIKQNKNTLNLNYLTMRTSNIYINKRIIRHILTPMSVMRSLCLRSENFYMIISS